MNGHHRLMHVDGLRGLAVLLMVLVHAAATWEPHLEGAWLIFGVIVSAAGGLAAPLFVALLGWGLAQRPVSPFHRLWRAGFLFFCQFVVNLSAPHLFEPWTPGVLSLMGMLMLLEPVWRNLLDSGQRSLRFFLAFAIVCLLTIVLTTWQGPSQWGPRVSTTTAEVLLRHVFLTGLYPVFPWIVFAWFGLTVASHQSDSKRQQWLRRVTAVGMGISACFLALSIREGRPWALPTGDATLTFFPANAAFLIAAITGLSMLWWLAECFSRIHRLAGLGRVSLTVYVLHFIPFTVFHAYEDVHQWGPALTTLVVVGYTAIWVVAGTWWYRRFPDCTLEACMRGWRRRQA